MQPSRTPAITGYDHVAEIATGPSASVHSFRSPLGVVVAIKVFEPGAEQFAEAELIALALIGDHPNIGTVLASGLTADGRSYLVMPLYPFHFGGRDGLTPLRALRAGVQLCGALSTAHAAAVLHRDIKPSNILITRYGEPVLIDFGIAAAAGAPGEVFAPRSLPWSPPEVTTGASLGSERADVYGLAASLWTVFAGAPPFARATSTAEQIVQQAMTGIPLAPLPDTLNRELVTTLLKALSPDPEDRSDALNFARALRDVQRRIGATPTEPALPSGMVPPWRLPAPPTAAPQPSRGGEVIERPRGIGVDDGEFDAPTGVSPVGLPPGWQAPPSPARRVTGPGVTGTGWPGAPAPAPAPSTEEGHAPPISRARGQWGAGSGRGSARRDQAHRGRPRRARREPELEMRVNTGFERRGLFRRALPATGSLQPGRLYDFWLEVGEPVRKSIETGTWGLPVEHLPDEAVLDVVIFPLSGSFWVDARTHRQHLVLHPEGSASVLRSPGVGRRSERRLRFAVRAPVDSRFASLRCNIYHEQVLLQSRLITAHIGRARTPVVGALRSVVDYSVTPNLDPAFVNTLAPHTVSIFMNDDGAGEHGFYFCGERNFDEVARISERDLDHLCTQARDALRRASWGTRDEWTAQSVYRYESDSADERGTHLADDLIDLARSGARLWDGLAPYASGSVRAADPWKREDSFRELMRAPGRLQMVRRGDLDLVVPVALVYDYPLDDPLLDPTLCADGLAALREFSADQVSQHPCFRGACANYDDLNVVCPGGFWGHRHEIGLPVSLANDTPPVTVSSADAIRYSAAGPTITTGFSSDATLVRRAQHRDVLHVLRSPLGWFTTEQANELVQMCKNTNPHLVYLLCHGGVTNDNTAFVEIGAPGGAYLTPHTFRRHGIDWSATHPLVMFNGCNTTALTATRQLEFVNTLVRYCAAAGVIGTEVTVFEDLACDFAEEFLRRMITEEQALGVAMRATRLTLLIRGNPLGLVYTAHASAGLTYRRLA